MKKPVRPLGWISRMRLRAATALTLAAVVLGPALVAAQNGARSPYSYKVLYDFCSLANCTDGDLPFASLIQDSKGNLYGTTLGNVFKVTKAGKETVLYTFTGGKDGTYSTSDLIRDSAGNLYGTTQSGGTSCSTYYCGTVFKLSKAGNETVLYRFTGTTDGGDPWAGLIRDSAGNLYGTTYYGGDLNCPLSQYGCGTVFKLGPAGKETVLHSFAGGTDSGFPAGGLVMDAKGNLYGTTYGNGTATPGTVFKVTKNGKEAVLYTFKNGSDGSQPMGTLIMDAKGNLYGTTSGGYGAVFKLTRAGKETVLWGFQGPPDGSNPQAGVVMDAAGNLYGTTGAGGDASCDLGSGCGTVFKLAKNRNESVLYRFTGGSDGSDPKAGLLLDVKGNLYGTTVYGGFSQYCPYGTNGCGVVFKMTPR
jgi:uncharacterized repeat protein (TIGR03803 family)